MAGQSREDGLRRRPAGWSVCWLCFVGLCARVCFPRFLREELTLRTGGVGAPALGVSGSELGRQAGREDSGGRGRARERAPGRFRRERFPGGAGPGE